jgi:hypothetical protein
MSDKEIMALVYLAALPLGFVGGVLLTRGEPRDERSFLLYAATVCWPLVLALCLMYIWHVFETPKPEYA